MAPVERPQIQLSYIEPKKSFLEVNESPLDTLKNLIPANKDSMQYATVDMTGGKLEQSVAYTGNVFGNGAPSSGNESNEGSACFNA